MATIKSILYLGSDLNLVQQIQDHCEKNISTKFQFIHAEFKENIIIDLVVRNSPNIVYVDFSDLSEVEDILRQLLFLKEYEKFKPTLFIAILVEDSNLLIQQNLYTSGFQFSYIKGTEFEIVMSYGLYIGLNETVHLPQYAKAIKINQELVIGMSTTISRMSLNNFIVETDLETDFDFLLLKLPLFKGLETNSFKIRSHLTNL